MNDTNPVANRAVDRFDPLVSKGESVSIGKHGSGIRFPI